MDDNENGNSPWTALPADLQVDSDAFVLPIEKLRDWSLVLQARRIPCRTRFEETGGHLLVPIGQFGRALDELRRHEEEDRHWPPPKPKPNELADNSMATVAVLVLLATFHNVTLLKVDLAGHHPVDWVALGNAHAGRILDGELWRLVTSLTLHADWQHLLGNVLIGGVFIVRLARDLGSGLGWSLLLASGVLGNLINAALHDPAHRAVGASTAVFGAVGILAALSVVRYRHNLRRRWPMPIAAALALLALLGTGGENTDLGAHLFGFGFGFILGLGTETLIGRHGRIGRRTNAALALGAVALVGGAWYAALLLG
ncbi:MAG: rhomboid family intramembrane serine protease [Desulfuromonadales bacterium]|nr:rhomboid family intramembrane serine protease [Desulfuromonadales bacterium]NIR33548.1 rhomboid family intramembrane serine protease [Desulfuromonadales bacterium]NIS41138.1 rhomboid family intramembrane serine protease [Desulfuromonadales bacterium]